VRFEAHLEAVRESLKSKDPARIKKAKGSLVLVLEDEGHVLRRMTVRVGAQVEVVEGRQELEGSPAAFVFAKLEDWIAFFDSAEASRLHSINFYGDLTVLERIAELRSQKISPLALRCGAGL
jgi:hypothetical protein